MIGYAVIIDSMFESYMDEWIKDPENSEDKDL